MKTTITKLVAACAVAFVFSVPARGKDPAPVEGDYTMHALYIYNFTKYVKWPSDEKTIKIGVVDNKTAEEYLQKMAKLKSNATSEITILNTKSETELGTCHIIFVPANNTHLAAKLIERFSGKPILIMTETEDLTKRGACVSFKIVSSKLRFQINEEAINARGMKIASTLTSLAEK